MLRHAVLATLLLALLAAPGAAALSVPPPPDRRVNDYAGALSPADRDRLEQQLIAREAASRNQVVVAVFRSLAGESLESTRSAAKMAIGEGARPASRLVFLTWNEHRGRYGIEGQHHRAIHPPFFETSWPALREGRTAAASRGIDASDWQSGHSAAPTGAGARGSIWLSEMAALFVVLVLIYSRQTASSAGVRRRGWTALVGLGRAFIGGAFGAGRGRQQRRRFSGAAAARAAGRAEWGWRVNAGWEIPREADLAALAATSRPPRPRPPRDSTFHLRRAMSGRRWRGPAGLRALGINRPPRGQEVSTAHRARKIAVMENADH